MVMRHLFKRSDDSLVVRRNEPVVFTEKVPAYQHLSVRCTTKMKVWDDQGNTFEVPAGDDFRYDNDTGKGVMVSYQPMHGKCPNREPVKLVAPPEPIKIKDMKEGDSGVIHYTSLYRLKDNTLAVDLLDKLKADTRYGIQITRVCDGWEVDFDKADLYDTLHTRSWLRTHTTPSYTAHKGPVVKVTGFDLQL
jgi:hypothetical protein